MTHTRLDKAAASSSPSPEASGKGDASTFDIVKAASCSEDADFTEDHHHLFPRHGSRWHALYHNVCAMVGAGVLGLPSTFSYLGWVGGVICLGVFMFVSWYTFILLVRMHELPPKQTGAGIRRFDTYSALSEYCLGKVRGWWALVPFQTIYLYGISVTYTVTGATNMAAVANLQGGAPGMDKVSYWILIYAAVQLLLCLVPNFSELGWVSLMGAVMSAFYSVVAVVLSAKNPDAPDVNYTPSNVHDPINMFFGIFSALSTAAFAFGGHNIALEVQATIPAGPNESTIPPMMFSVHTAFVLTAICYFTVSCTGFWAFGTSAPDNILDALQGQNGVITAAHLAVVLHVLASYQVFSFPLYDAAERYIIKNHQQLELEQRPQRRFLVRTSIRWLYVLTTAFLACLIPFFGDLMNLIGAVAITPTTFVLPCVLWVYWARPGWKSFDFWLAMVVGTLMTCVGVMGTIAAIRSISQHASTYKPFT